MNTKHLRRVFRKFVPRRTPVAQTTPDNPQLRMVCRFAESSELPVPTAPDDYKLFRYSPAFKGQWLDLLNESGEFGILDRKALRSQVLSSLLPDGGALVSHEGRLVACAAACSYERFEPYALLMFVVVLAAHRGRGLGTTVTVEVMRAARRVGRAGILLHTDDERLPAIRTYLKLGFEPDTEWEPSAKGRWEAVLSGVARPAGEALGTPGRES